MIENSPCAPLLLWFLVFKRLAWPVIYAIYWEVTLAATWAILFIEIMKEGDYFWCKNNGDAAVVTDDLKRDYYCMEGVS